MVIAGADQTAKFDRKIKMGMVGGGRDAFIGAVHRAAATMDGNVEFVAGALSSSPEKAKASGQDLYLADDRNYASWQEMLDKELARPVGERIDFVSIVTPNYVHHPIAKAFTEAGINVVIEKPMVFNSEQAQDLVAAVEKAGTVFCVTYSYTGYPMVKQARHMVQTGKIGEVRKVIVEYPQGWLITKLEDTGQKQAAWRTDPKIAGIGGAIGDIGSHAENLVGTIAGLEIAEICADLTIFVPERKLDDDANLLLHYTNGARGILFASQICTGQENNLNIRIYGTTGALTWYQENPNYLYYQPADQPVQIFARGNGYLCDAAVKGTRLPTGHPEAYHASFANIYNNVCDTIRAKLMGLEPDPSMLDFPTVYDGARGVKFIEKTVESSQSTQKWTPFN